MFPGTLTEQKGKLVASMMLKWPLWQGGSERKSSKGMASVRQAPLASYTLPGPGTIRIAKIDRQPSRGGVDQGQKRGLSLGKLTFPKAAATEASGTAWWWV